MAGFVVSAWTLFACIIFSCSGECAFVIPVIVAPPRFLDPSVSSYRTRTSSSNSKMQTWKRKSCQLFLSQPSQQRGYNDNPDDSFSGGGEYRRQRPNYKIDDYDYDDDGMAYPPNYSSSSSSSSSSMPRYYEPTATVLPLERNTAYLDDDLLSPSNSNNNSNNLEDKYYNSIPQPQDQQQLNRDANILPRRSSTRTNNNVVSAMDDGYTEDYTDNDDAYYMVNDDDDIEDDYKLYRNGRDNMFSRDREDPATYEDDDDDVLSEEPGNFWSNPSARVDDQDQLVRRRRQRPTTTSSSSSIRSGAPKPPAPLVDFYNRLFWYGFGDDSNNNMADDDRRLGDSYATNGQQPPRSSPPPDKTMFGGTKGKFNGLAFLNAGLDTVPDELRPRYRNNKASNNNNSWQNEEDEDDDYDQDDGYDNNAPPRRSRRSSMEFDDNERIESTMRKSEQPDASTQPLPLRPIPMTAPYDPARPSNRRRESSQNSWNDNNDDFDVADGSRQRRRPQQRPARSFSRSPGDRPRRGDRGDWVANTVSSWFDTTTDNDNTRERRQGPQQQQYVQRSARRNDSYDRNSNSNNDPDNENWSPLSFLDTFLGLDRDRLQDQAELYDRRMGTNAPKTRRSNAAAAAEYDRYPVGEQMRQRPRGRPAVVSDSRSKRQPSGYRYYDPEQTEQESGYPARRGNAADFIDTEPIPRSSESNHDDETTVSETENSSVDEGTGPKLSWEERALAVERVPPANVPAWGPSGDLGVDARTKAVTDAVEDIQTAKFEVDEWETRVAADQETIAYLRVDAELERQKWWGRNNNNNSNSRPSSSSSSSWPRGMTVEQINERIRRIDRKVDEAARRLRYTVVQRDVARRDLVALEARHWAVLCFYNADQAEGIVADSLKELEELEPAVRWNKERNASLDHSGSGALPNVG